MKILILNGSPRPQGHTARMIEAFSAGVEKAGHELIRIDVCRKDIRGCLACEYCHTRGNGNCIQKDDMSEVSAALQEAEMLVIASPIYYHGISGQLKCCIDRFYAPAFPKGPEKLKKIALFLSSGDPQVYDGALFSYRGDFLGYLGLQDMGVFTWHEKEDFPARLQELQAFGESL